jgi:hypothetical protein
MKLIASAFVKAKRSFGPALKDKTNPAFRSKYADLGACIDSVEDALLENGIAFVQETFEDTTGVTVETVFIHESGEAMRCGKLHVPASKQDPQGYGSALTYARRYSLMAACGIAPEDDDGNAAVKHHTPKADDPIVGFGPHHSKLIRATAAAAIQAFNEGNEWKAYEEVVSCLDTVGAATDRNSVLLALSSIFQPYSALRASLKKHMEAEREKQKAVEPAKA